MKALAEITKPYSNNTLKARQGQLRAHSPSFSQAQFLFPVGRAFGVNWWKPLWCNCVFIHDSTWREGLAKNACGFVNKSSKLTEESRSNNKRFFFPDGWVTIQRKTRPRFSAVEHSGINFTSVKSQLTIDLIDEDYPAEKEEALWRDSSWPSVYCIFSQPCLREQNNFRFGTKPWTHITLPRLALPLPG